MDDITQFFDKIEKSKQSIIAFHNKCLEELEKTDFQFNFKKSTYMTYYTRDVDNYTKICVYLSDCIGKIMDLRSLKIALNRSEGSLRIQSSSRVKANLDILSRDYEDLKLSLTNLKTMYEVRIRFINSYQYIMGVTDIDRA